MKKIGVTASEPHGPGGEVHPDVAPYLAAVRRAGGEPVVLANDADPNVAIASVAGILVTGGADVDPARYGGRAEHANSQRSRYRGDRDAF